MVFIHGGGFVGGSAIGIRSDRLIEENVIFVVLNYRLGPFGFLSTQDQVVPGNNGLKDQLFALQWVHNNIKLFGGSPDQVTLFGQSSGGGSVGYHLINQNAKGLFQGAILQSGTSITSLNYQRDPRTIAFKTAALLNETFLTNNDSNALVDYFLNLEAKDLDSVSQKYHDLVKKNIIFLSIFTQNSIFIRQLAPNILNYFKDFFGLQFWKSKILTPC